MDIPQGKGPGLHAMKVVRVQPRDRVLFLVHIEPMFEKFFPDNYRNKIRDAASRYDRVIALDSEVDTGVCEWLKRLLPYIEIEHWSWGYEAGQIYDYDEDNPEQWIIPASGHDFTWIPPFVRYGRFKDYSIGVGGGHRLECLADWEDVLEACGYKYRLIQSIIYG